MASLLTIASGVYVVKPDKQYTNATNYVDLFTKSRQRQEELAFKQAVAEFDMKKDQYSLQMKVYQAKLESLLKQRSDLQEQAATREWNVAKYNADKLQEAKIVNAKNIVENSFKRKEQMITGGSEIEIGQGVGGGSKKPPSKFDKLTREQNKVFNDQIVPIAGDAIESLMDETEVALESGPFAATTPEQKNSVRLTALTEALRGTDDAAYQKLFDELATSSNLNAPEYQRILNLYISEQADKGGGGGRLQLTDRKTGPKYPGLDERPYTMSSAQIEDKIPSAVDDRLKALELELLGLKEPALTIPPDFNLLGRTAEIKDAQFGVNPSLSDRLKVEKFLRSKTKGIEESQPGPQSADRRLERKVLELPDDDIDLPEQGTTDPEPDIEFKPADPQGEFAIKVVRDSLLLTPEARKKLEDSEEGQLSQKLFGANANSKGGADEALRKTKAELQKQYANDPNGTKLYNAMQLLMVYYRLAKERNDPKMLVDKGTSEEE